MRVWLRQHVGDGWLLFLLLPVLYFLLYGSEGFADTDQGFVPGLAWRVKSGQLPYLDFVYVRPPLTPVLHSLELWIWPLKWQMLGMRLDFYLMMAASVAFAVLMLRRWVDFAAWGLSPWWLAALGFLFGVHNFPPMPWHTVDGIFFGTLGLWLVSHPTARWQMVAGLVALALAGMAKQPFFLMLPLGIVLLFALQTRKVALLSTLAGLATLALIGILCIANLPDGFWGAMMDQVMGASKGGDFLKAGVKGYLLPAAGLSLLGGGGYLLLRRASPSSPIKPLLGWVLLLGLAVLPFGYFAWAVWKDGSVPPGLGAYHAIFMGGLVHAGWLWWTGNRNGALGFLALSALAWTSSLSWGYAYPALFCLPGIVGWVGIARALLANALPRRLPSLMTGIALTGFFALQWYPYRDQPRWDLVAGAGDLFPQLQGIHTSPENLGKMQELKALAQGKGGNFAVLPAQPGIHYLMQEVPVVGIDWEHDAEIGASQMMRIEQEMQRPGLLAIVEGSRRAEANSPNANYASRILRIVLSEWKLVEQGRFFEVYARSAGAD